MFFGLSWSSLAEVFPSSRCILNNLLSESRTHTNTRATQKVFFPQFAVGGLSQQRLAQFSQIPLSCAITSANFTNRSRQWPKPLNLHSSAPLPLCDGGDCFSLFAGSQQSQDQTGRRSGSVGEKHNENGVRARRRCPHKVIFHFFGGRGNWQYFSFSLCQIQKHSKHWKTCFSVVVFLSRATESNLPQQLMSRRWAVFSVGLNVSLNAVSNQLP